MKTRSTCRLEIEMLERRDAPSASAILDVAPQNNGHGRGDPQASKVAPQGCQHGIDAHAVLNVPNNMIDCLIP